MELIDDLALCPPHHAVFGDEWAASNRLICAFIHRKVEPARLLPGERFDGWTSEE